MSCAQELRCYGSHPHRLQSYFHYKCSDLLKFDFIRLEKCNSYSFMYGLHPITIA
jgi:hypothetical protein